MFLPVLLLIAACSGPELDRTDGAGGDGGSAEAVDAAETTADGATGQAGDAAGGEEAAGDGAPSFAVAAGSSTETTLIRVDQFGYRPGDPKVAVIADPEVGFDADVDFAPGELMEVRRAGDDVVVFDGPPQVWADGAVHEQSGDRGWWFDFSELEEPGEYRVVDPASGFASLPFRVDEDVYDEVLDAALRMFWYNRANTAHPEELAGAWSDEAAFLGPGQDGEARSVDDQSNADTALDLRGGWFDAGDTNKYVTFASEPVHLLLAAYRSSPELFDDALGIPESANGIPDIIDEIKWEIDWLERMQQSDGGVLTKVGLIDSEEPSLPSESRLPRYYEEVCSSATIVAAGMFAHAAMVFSTVDGLEGEVDRLSQRAESAWDWFQANERRDDCDPQIVRAGDADLSIEAQADAEVVAAIYLSALSDDDRYHEVVANGFEDMLPFESEGFGNYGPDQSEALLQYRQSSSADQAVVAAIDRRIEELASSSTLFGFDPNADLYRAFMPDYSYHWGSNMVKANVGTANLAVGDVAGGTERALAHLHYFHGVNPLSLVYLSNMGDLGGERSVESLFHFWFGENTAYDVGAGSEVGVAPGFVVGGPNQAYSGAEAPPAGQPALKSYRDWSAYGSEPSWEITEPAIYYQAAYVRLLAAILANG